MYGSGWRTDVCQGKATIFHALHTSGDSWYWFQSYIWQGLHILILLDLFWSPAIFMHISVCDPVLSLRETFTGRIHRRALPVLIE